MSNNEFIIEKDIPMPAVTKGSKYPFDQMEVGDSFVFDGKKATIQGAVTQRNRRGDGRRFAVRSTPEGVRVWRVE